MSITTHLEDRGADDGGLGFRVSTSYHAASLSLHSVLIIDTYIYLSRRVR
jgi:hypothetical protein